MDYEWDEAKRIGTISARGLDFAIAVELFDGRAMLTSESPRGEEMRFRSICKWNGAIIAVVWTPRDDSRRIISLRRASDGEERSYQAFFGE